MQKGGQIVFFSLFFMSAAGPWKTPRLSGFFSRYKSQYTIFQYGARESDNNQNKKDLRHMRARENKIDDELGTSRHVPKFLSPFFLFLLAL